MTTSQPKPPRSGNPHIVLTGNGPCIAAIHTLVALWEQYATVGAYTLLDLFQSQPGSTWFFAPTEPERTAAEATSTPIPKQGQQLADVSVNKIAETATAAGCETTAFQLWTEGNDDHFASEPRRVEGLRVRIAWRYTRVTGPSNGSGGVVTIGEVLPGDYLILAAGASADVKAVCRTERLPTTADLAAIDRFRADRLSAGCSRCHRHWTASKGRYAFSPTDHTGPIWQLDPAELGLVTATAPCPAPDCNGRLAFSAERT